MKFLTPVAVAVLASLATLAHASSLPADTTNTDGKYHINGPRDPYTDGAKASKFDVYSEGARITDPRDPFTDGAHS